LPGARWWFFNAWLYYRKAMIYTALVITNTIPIYAANRLLLLSMALLLSSCSTMSYYSQSIVGHGKLMLARVPLDKAIESADEPLKSQLLLSRLLRTFAIDHLGLPSSQSYTRYVPLAREFPVWTVVAASKFSLTPRQWCYPVIGCASYRGYFDKAAAHRFARQLRSQGLETHVGGVPAYSTLGWFADPLLPSMMRYGEAEFAETLFHEIAHQQLYINGDSDFNEAFATIVGETGALRWLQANNPAALPAYRNKQLIQQQFFSLIEKTKQALQALYHSGKPKLEMLIEKQLVMKQLDEEYERLKTEQWNGQGWYQSWFDEPLNNAKFAALSTYRQRVPELRALLDQCDQSLPRFYIALALLTQDYQKVIVPTSCHHSDVTSAS
jgi:predicted aminopeptidase